MRVKTKALVLSAIRYQEMSLIVRCFTESDGLKSYFVPSAFSTKSANRKTAYFQPLTLLELEAEHKNKGTLERFREIRIAQPYQSLHLEVVKSTIALFLADLLQHSIREEQGNTDLFSFLESAILWLDAHDSVADFHLVCMLRMTRYLGFFPDTESQGNHFDLLEGRFSPSPSYHSLDPMQTGLLKRLLELDFSAESPAFSSAQRRELLRLLNDYYRLHLEGYRSPKSIDILHEVFS